MKRFIPLIVIVGVAAFLFALFSKSQQAAPTTEEVAAEPTPPPAVQQPTPPQVIDFPEEGVTSESGVAYKPFSPDVIGNGEFSLLFFYAAWCATCQGKDVILQNLYNEEDDLVINTYKVDFDTELDLRQKYGVVKQDAFVLIDGNGDKVLMESGLGEEELDTWLSPASDDEGAEEGLVGVDDDSDEMQDSKDSNNSKEATVTPTPSPNPAPAPTPVVKEEPVAANGTYTAYKEGVIGNGQVSLLFFYAAWCPKCQTNDALLTDWYGSKAFPVSSYKIDYDTATSLKSKYGVVQQDTFILIDGSGAEITRTAFPSQDKLMQLISG